MARRMFRGLRPTLPALLVAAVWFVWWVFPERPLRTCPLGIAGSWSWGFYVRPKRGDWALIIPNDDKYPAAHESVALFDPVRGTCQLSPTPGRSPKSFVVAPDTAVWAWSDADGAVHVAALPENRPLFRTPADSQKAAPRLFISPAGEWLAIVRAENGPVELWDAARRTNAGVFDDGPGAFAHWHSGRLAVSASPIATMGSPGCELVSFSFRRVRLSRHGRSRLGPGRRRIFAAGEKYLRVYGRSPVTDDVWDLSTSPPRNATVDELPNNDFVSPDGKYQLAFKRNWILDWELENVATRAVILRADDGARFERRPFPLAPPFSPDGRLLILSQTRQRFRLPGSSPQWLTDLCDSIGLTRASTHILMCEAATGREARALPGDDMVHVSATGDRMWLMRPVPYGSQLIVDEWPVAPPSPPWWLWALTAVPAGWYGRKIARGWTARKTLQIPAPGVA